MAEIEHHRATVEAATLNAGQQAVAVVAEQIGAVQAGAETRGVEGGLSDRGTEGRAATADTEIICSRSQAPGPVPDTLPR